MRITRFFLPNLYWIRFKKSGGIRFVKYREGDKLVVGTPMRFGFNTCGRSYSFGNLTEEHIKSCRCYI